jgi:hypothetical protein
MTPLPILFVGFLCAVLGGMFALVGLAGHSLALAFAGWVIGGLGALALFVGLIAYAVEVGVRAADR